MALYGPSLLPAHSPQPLSPASGDGVSLASTSAFEGPQAPTEYFGLPVLLNASPYSQHTVRSNNTKMLEFGTEEDSLQGHAKKWVARALKIPSSPKLSAKPFYEKGKRGAWLVVATFLVSEPFFLMSGHDIPVNLQQNKLFSFMIRNSKVPKLSLHPLRSRLWPRGEGKLLQESW